MINTSASIRPIHLPNAQNVQVDMLMLNELHTLISGNKYFKLLHNIQQAQAQNATTLVSMGGAYSNHLVALAVAAHGIGMKTKAYIRGEKKDVLNSHLAICVQHNMELMYIARTHYATYRDTSPRCSTNEYWIPEGGGNQLGVQGCQLITQFTTSQLASGTTAHFNFNTTVKTPVSELFTNNYYSYCVCACGTGTTLAGIITALQHTAVHILGIQILKGDNYLTEHLQHNYGIVKTNLWHINDQFHGGGYAKTPAYLIDFVAQQKALQHITLDTVYTGKMLYAVVQLLAQQYFAPNARVLLIHSGGIH